MNIIFLTVIFFLVFSLIATRVVYHYSIKNNIIDIPNDRSSHVIPTPRGGGISISLSIFIGAIIVYLSGLISLSLALAITFGVFIIAVVGWIDDHKNIVFYWRFIFYSIAAILVIFWMGSLEQIKIGTIIIPLSLSTGYIITFMGIVWLTNLYNFMDGTDALAAVQAICTSLLGGVLLLMEGDTGLALICFIITSSSMGFLYWNWPPARIFMGDVGSCVLGFVFALIAVVSDTLDKVSVCVWCILLSVFICDATFTLLKRMFNKEKWYSAHRSHSYQKTIRMGMSHQKLALIVLLINLFFVWPMAYLAHTMPVYTVAIAVFDVIFMFIIWWLIQVRLDYKEDNVVNVD